MNNPLLTTAMLALLLTPLAAAEEQPNTYGAEEPTPADTEAPPPCTPIVLILDPPGYAINWGCINDIKDDLLPIG